MQPASDQVETILEPLQCYEIAREQIRHEDGLINSRVTWLQVFQGLLFTALLATLGLFKEKEITNYVHAKFALSALVFLLCVLGIASSIVASRAVGNARTHLSHIRKWWGDLHPPAQFPKLSGPEGITEGWFEAHAPTLLLGFALAWVIVLGIFAFVARGQ